MTDTIITLNEQTLKNQLGELVRASVEETLNKMLDAEADQLANAGKYERTAARKDTRAGYYGAAEPRFRFEVSHYSG